jgi:hypothetical protein
MWGDSGAFSLEWVISHTCGRNFSLIAVISIGVGRSGSTQKFCD